MFQTCGWIQTGGRGDGRDPRCAIARAGQARAQPGASALIVMADVLHRRWSPPGGASVAAPGRAPRNQRGPPTRSGHAVFHL